MSSELAGAVASVRLLWDLVKANKTLANYNELVAAVSEVNADLLSAQAMALASQKEQLALTKRVGELEKEVGELKDWNQEAERYLLTNTGTGMFYYCLKPGMEQGEPPHHLCAHCFSDKKKSILQLFVGFYGSIVRTCHRCKSEHTFSPEETMRLFPDLIKIPQ